MREIHSFHESIVEAHANAVPRWIFADSLDEYDRPQEAEVWRRPFTSEWQSLMKRSGKECIGENPTIYADGSPEAARSSSTASRPVMPI